MLSAFTPLAGMHSNELMSFIFADEGNVQSLSADALSSDALFVKTEPISPGGGLHMAYGGYGNGMFNDSGLMRSAADDLAAAQHFVQRVNELQNRLGQT